MAIEIVTPSIKDKLDTLIIDDIVIDFYSDYFVLNEKTYPVEPVRSANGIMEDLNALSTFIVPRIFIKFTTIKAEQFIKLLSAINNNEVYITYYDLDSGNMYKRPFYLKPHSRANIYKRVEDGNAIFNGIRGLELEFVATLRDLEEISSEE